ncbi:MAG TPA: hypothetical protein VMJ92_04730 [Candidatus Limnocylindrales bacterium]|nr:hypothetical protein [Candidatus Limnocylindrales bacterium]
MHPDLAVAISRIDGRFGARTVTTASGAVRRAGERRFATGTSLDALLGGGVVTGAPLALIGPGSTGKVTLALHAAAGAQREGAMVAWLDPAASLDPLAARRAGVALDRLVVLRPRGREGSLLAAAAALRCEGFRLVVVDTGPAFAPALAVDDLAPLLPTVRGSTSALLVIAERPPARLALPSCVLERTGWERRFGRTAGWTVSASRAFAAEAALFRVAAHARVLEDLGVGPAARMGIAG